MKSSVGPLVFRMFFILAAILLVSSTVSLTEALEISDHPLDLQVQSAPPTVVFILDNSANTDSEFLTYDSNGLFEELLYIFPATAYLPAADHIQGPDKTLDELQRRNWRSQWHAYNRMFYNPYHEYLPWTSTPRFELHDADLHNPLSDPTKSSPSDTRIDLSAAFFSISIRNETLVIPIAHYFTLLDANGNGRYDDGETIYLITWTDADSDNRLDTTDNPSDDQRCYYRFQDDGDHHVEDDELIPLTSEQEKNRIRPAWYDGSGRFVRFKTDREDLQNFANWFSYHRRREFVIKAAVAGVVANLHQIQVGLYASNGDMHLEAQPINVSSGREGGMPLDETQTVLEALYEMESDGNNKLRDSLDEVGRYFHKQKQSVIGQSPFWPENASGACQRAHAVIITASYWDDDFSGLGNVDGKSGRPFGDAWNDTLADIALHYYEIDIAPDLPDLLPPDGCDMTVHQHLITYGLSLGIEGTIPLDDFNQNVEPDEPKNILDPCLNRQTASSPNWPFPAPGSPATLDDLWHATVNGRGLYAYAGEPQELYLALERFAEHFGRRFSAAATVSGHSALSAGGIAYRTEYNSENWSGDVVAYGINHSSVNQDTGNQIILWRADERLHQIHDAWDRRCIITFGGPWQKPQGIPFRYEFLSGQQRRALGSDLVGGSPADHKARQLLEYLRGRPDPAFRSRYSILGDIVHSVPLMAEESIFVGGNDGMLHVFDAATGYERFAYIPNLVMSRLHHLGERDYVSNHRYYVDGELYTGEVMTDGLTRQMLLVGGLGKGGKGYYCLRIGSRRRLRTDNIDGAYENLFSIKEFSNGHSESDLAQIVLWEYPASELPENNPDNAANGINDEEWVADRDMGYSFSQAYAVNANTFPNQFRPVVIFGNGYDSQNGHAVLYILDALEGHVIRKIDTGAGEDNGLSTPALIDINMDRRVDYVFAGDLKGNLWKFDLTSSDPEHWGVAYGQDRNGNGIIDASQGDEPMPLIKTAQPITGRPDVMRMHSICAAQAPGYFVIFGTGQYLSSGDRSDFSQHSIYGVWDYGDASDDSEYLGTIIDHANGILSSGLVLLRRTVIGETINGEAMRELSDEEIVYELAEDTIDGDGCAANNSGLKQEPNPKKYAGWFLDFPISPDPLAYRGERVIAGAQIRGGKAILNSFAPLDEPCRAGGGLSWIYYLDGCSGNPAKDQIGEFMLPWRHEGRILDIFVQKHVKHPTLDEMVIADQNGKIARKQLPGEKWGRVHWRQN